MLFTWSPVELCITGTHFTLIAKLSLLFLPTGLEVYLITAIVSCFLYDGCFQDFKHTGQVSLFMAFLIILVLLLWTSKIYFPGALAVSPCWMYTHILYCCIILITLLSYSFLPSIPFPVHQRTMARSLPALALDVKLSRIFWGSDEDPT